MATRTITFNGHLEGHQERFDVLYLGFCATGNQKPRKGIELARKENAILDKLDAVSLETTSETRGEHRVLKPFDELQLQLDVPQYEMVKEYISEAAFPTRAKYFPDGRAQARVVDWLISLPVDAAADPTPG